MPLKVLYDGASPGMAAGVIQVNFQLPAAELTGINQPNGGATLPIAINVGGQLSTAAEVYISY